MMNVVILNVIMLNVIMLSFVMLNVVMLSFVMPNVVMQSVAAPALALLTNIILATEKRLNYSTVIGDEKKVLYRRRQTRPGPNVINKILSIIYHFL
jgi:hypothetical protein